MRYDVGPDLSVARSERMLGFSGVVSFTADRPETFEVKQAITCLKK